MKYNAKLIYFEGCPNAKKATVLLEKLNIPFELICQDRLEKNNPYHNYSSPTLILNNAIIFGSQTSEQSEGCSIQLPSEREVQKRLEEVGIIEISSKKGFMGFIGGVGSALLVGFCPICIPAVGAFLSAIGLGFMVDEAVLKPLLIALILLALGGFFWSYKKEHKNILPFILGTLMSISMYVGRYVYVGETLNPILMYGSIVGIIGISIWNLYLRKKSNCTVCEVPRKSS